MMFFFLWQKADPSEDHKIAGKTYNVPLLGLWKSRTHFITRTDGVLLICVQRDSVSAFVQYAHSGRLGAHEPTLDALEYE